MLDAIITSKTRMRLLLRFFLNPNVYSYLRELASELGESTNAVRVELDRLSEAGYLEKKANGNRVLYKANEKHPLFPEIHSIVKKYTGIDLIAEQIIQRLGNLKAAYVIGDYAKGKDTGIIDIVLVGEIDMQYLHKVIEKVEKLINRKIRPLVLGEDEVEKFREKLKLNEALVLMKER